MPDPFLYSLAMIAAASVSMLVILALGWLFRANSSARINLVSVPGIGLGLATGFAILKLQLDWPPTNAIGRFLVIVVPVSIVIEIAASITHQPRWIVWLMRMLLAAATGRILLHASVYLGGPRSEWTETQAILVLALCGSGLLAEWGLLSWLSRRSPGAIVPLGIVFVTQSAAITIMLAGYVTGGATAIVFVAAITGSVIASGLLVKRPDSQGAIGIGLVGLYGLVFIGRFFGALSTTAALTLMSSPLLCWAMEIPILRRQRRWIVGVCCLFLVAIPLTVLLVFAKQYFDQHTAPLL
jgi:hypothetical protein